MKYSSCLKDVETLANAVKTGEASICVCFWANDNGEVKSFGFGDKLKTIGVVEIIKNDLITQIIMDRGNDESNASQQKGTTLEAA